MSVEYVPNQHHPRPAGCESVTIRTKLLLRPRIRHVIDGKGEPCRQANTTYSSCKPSGRSCMKQPSPICNAMAHRASRNTTSLYPLENGLHRYPLPGRRRHAAITKQSFTMKPTSPRGPRPVLYGRCQQAVTDSVNASSTAASKGERQTDSAGTGQTALEGSENSPVCSKCERAHVAGGAKGRALSLHTCLSRQLAIKISL